MERRLLGRNQGRTDDNIETIRKRFHVGAAAQGRGGMHWGRGLGAVRGVCQPGSAGAQCSATLGLPGRLLHCGGCWPHHAVRFPQEDERHACLPQVFIDQSMPIIEYYEKRGRVRKINADRDPDTIYEQVRQLFVGM